MSEISDAELKAMRDRVYGHVISNLEWDKIKDNWRADVEWLRGRDTAKK